MSLVRINRDHLVMYGGYSNSSQPSGDAWLLDMTKWTWQSLPPCMSGKDRLWHVSVEIDGNVLVHGGVENDILDPNADQVPNGSYHQTLQMRLFAPRRCTVRTCCCWSFRHVP